MTSPIERAARALCTLRGADPDALEPGMCPYSDDTEIIDGHLPNGDPGFFVWRLYVGDVRAVLAAIREPSEGMVMASAREAPQELWFADQDDADGEVRAVWGNMIDAALSEKDDLP